MNLDELTTTCLEQQLQRQQLSAQCLAAAAEQLSCSLPDLGFDVRLCGSWSMLSASRQLVSARGSILAVLRLHSARGCDSLVFLKLFERFHDGSETPETLTSKAPLTPSPSTPRRLRRTGLARSLSGA
jgi:hypothetical protein